MTFDGARSDSVKNIPSILSELELVQRGLMIVVEFCNLLSKTFELAVYFDDDSVATCQLLLQLVHLTHVLSCTIGLQA